ncbi:MAG: AAA family ATPase [Streptosporangiales bacterium]|nr:AAA family ATPase [Streptosporangiales bacterium]
MRLHRLRLTAFGPFAGTEEVDFDALGQAGLFLVHGPTGAGKTSVLDSVCFALYGVVPGVRDHAKRLHSDHAPLDRGPEVELELTLRGRRLKFIRSPRWTRPKKRGEGFIDEQARVTVQEYTDGAWTALATRLDEAGQLVTHLLGMSPGQFCQVVMLPQGDFARFLRAGPEERRGVLEQIFATQVFTDVERWLADRRTQAYRLLSEEVAAVRGVATRVAEAAGADLPEEEDPEALPGWAEELHAAAGAGLDTAVTEAERATARLAAARQADERARELADRKQRYAAALDRSGELEAHATEYKELTRRLERAQQAEAVLPLINAAGRRVTEAERAEELAGRRLAAVRPLIDMMLPEPGDLAAAKRERRDEAARLEQLRGDATRVRELRTGREELAETVRAREAERAVLADRLEALPARRAALTEELETARAASAAGPAAEAEERAAADRLTAARERDRLATELTEAEDALRAAVDEHQRLLDAYLTMQQERLAGIAAELALGLVDSEPCAVCGSTTHPSPAEPADGAPQAEDETEAWERADTARERRDEATGRAVELRERLRAATAAARPPGAVTAEPPEEPGEATRTRAGTPAKETGKATARSARRAKAWPSVEEAADALRAVRERSAAARAAAEAVTRLGTELAEVERELETVRARAAELDTAAAAAEERDAQLAAEIERLTLRLDAARGTDPTLETRIDRLNAEADALDEAAEAIRHSITTGHEARAALRTASDAAVRAGFGGAPEAAGAALDGPEREDLRARIRAYEDARAAVAEQLADTELTAAATAPDPDLAATAAELAAADEQAGEATARRARITERHDRLAELGAELDAAVDRWRPAAAAHTVARRLAELATGTSADNRRRMRLAAYVLMARLEQVVAAANVRLAGMSAGRYELRVSDERAAGQSRGGLGLRVLDAWTGQERDPATLSGGETFIGSLALALGLGDVATAEAGGAEIGTLFVDEGFGTLDDETLDEVMDVLDGLRAGGRAVGVVSHVADLRTRITTRLKVTKTQTGSTITQ